MSRRILFLALPLLLLAAYVALVEWPQRQREQEEAEKAVVVVEFEIDDVRRVEALHGDARIVLERNPDRLWYIREPIQTAASGIAVEAWLDELLDAERYYTVEETLTSERESEFGLDAKSALLLQIERYEKPTLTLRVGRLNPTGGAAYYQRLGDPALHLGSGSLRDLVPESYQHLRDRTLFDVEHVDIVQLEVEGPAGSWAVRRDAFNLWYLDDESQKKVKAWFVRPIVYELAATRVEEYLSDEIAPEEWPAYGLDPPTARLCWRTDDGRAGCLRIGNETEQAGFAYARRDSETTLLRLSATLLKHIQFDPAELPDASPIDEDFTQLRGMVVNWPDGYQMVSAGQGFDQRTQPGPEIQVELHELNAITQNVFYGLARLQPTGRLEMGPDTKFETFLGEEPLAVRLQFEDHERLLRLGTRESDHSHWLQLDDGRALFRVERGFAIRVDAWRQVATHRAEP